MCKNFHKIPVLICCNVNYNKPAQEFYVSFSTSESFYHLVIVVHILRSL
jgi:hypothetical protein